MLQLIWKEGWTPMQESAWYFKKKKNTSEAHSIGRISFIYTKQNISYAFRHDLTFEPSNSFYSTYEK